jgi:hypothetical protein
MPPRLIISRQFGMRKGEQFTPELIWQSMVLRLIFQANLATRGETFVNMRSIARPAQIQPRRDRLSSLKRSRPVAIHGRSIRIATLLGMRPRAASGNAARRARTRL